MNVQSIIKSTICHLSLLLLHPTAVVQSSLKATDHSIDFGFAILHPYSGLIYGQPKESIAELLGDR